MTIPSGYSFDGEPRLCMVDGGTTIEVRGGQPVMDAGEENGVLISLFTLPEWWGNYVLDKKYRIEDSKFDEYTSKPVTRSNLIDAEKEAVRALKWRVDQGVASKITADVGVDLAGMLEITIQTHGPKSTIETLLLQKHGLNWVKQATDPAYARLSDDYR